METEPKPDESLDIPDSEHVGQHRPGSTTELQELQKPVTEQQVSNLVWELTGTSAQMIVRRMAFEMGRLQKALQQIEEDAGRRRKKASDALYDPDAITPYANTDLEKLCYWRGYREGLTGINATAHDALKGKQQAVRHVHADCGAVCTKSSRRLWQCPTHGDTPQDEIVKVDSTGNVIED